MHENCYVAYIDILGFKDIINDVYKNNDFDKFNNIKNAIDVATKLSFHFPQKSIDSLKYRLFSDCLSVSVKCEDDYEKDFYNSVALLETISFYQYILMDEGILTRGGVTIGKHYIDENMIFSEGLVKAYKIEQQLSLHPRILIDEDIINKIRNNHHTYLDDVRELLKKLIIQDWDEKYFVNPYFIHTLINKIKEGSVTNQISDPDAQAYINNKLNIQHTGTSQIDFSYVDINDTLNKHKSIFIDKVSAFKRNDSNIITKYLWILNFIDWNLAGKANIDFNGIEIPTIEEMQAKKKAIEDLTENKI